DCYKSTFRRWLDNRNARIMLQEAGAIGEFFLEAVPVTASHAKLRHEIYVVRKMWGNHQPRRKLVGNAIDGGGELEEARRMWISRGPQQGERAIFRPLGQCSTAFDQLPERFEDQSVRSLST